MILETNPHNPRTISKAAYEKLKASIERNPDGLTANKIAYKDGIIISGNQRYRALTELGLEHKKEWFKDLSGWTPEQIDEWIIQSNISAGEWDWDILANEWEQTDLEEWGVDTSQEWDNKKDLPEDIDEIPEVKTPISKLGDLWLLGNHRVLCGDSTDKTTVELLMDGKKADMVFTSPPYNSGDVAMRGGGQFTFGKSGSKTLYENYSDNKTPDEYFDFCIAILQRINEIVEEKHSVFWNVSYNANSRDDYGKIIFSDKNPFRVKETIIWCKSVALPITSEGIFSRNSELIFLLSTQDKYLTNQKIGQKSVYWNTWNINSSGSQSGEHKACFPVSLPAKAIEDFTLKDHKVFDPFIGSGSTLIACEQTERLCYGLELDPLYVDVICKRWQTLTGQMPVLESSGEAHDFMV